MHRASTILLMTALSLAVVGLAAAPVLGQPVLYVDDDASTNGNGLTWTTAYKYLQDALSTARADSSFTEIRVAGGVYKADLDQGGTITPGDRLATFQLLNDVAVKGGYAGLADPGNPDVRDLDTYQSTLSGDLSDNDDPVDFPGGPTFAENTCRVVTGSGAGPTAILDGFTITAGVTESPSLPQWSGGGMYNATGSPTVSNCTFVGNFAGYSGAGMYNDQSSPTLLNCTFAGNAADYGGGMHNVGSHPMLINCTFTGNLATGDG